MPEPCTDHACLPSPVLRLTSNGALAVLGLLLALGHRLGCTIDENIVHCVCIAVRLGSATRSHVSKGCVVVLKWKREKEGNTDDDAVLEGVWLLSGPDMGLGKRARD